MNKSILAGVAALALTHATLVMAQDSTANPGASAAQQGIQGSGPVETPGSGAMVGAATGMQSKSYRSYKNGKPNSFRGKIAARYRAKQLMGRQLLDLNGNVVGKVDDLLIGQGGDVHDVLVDVGNFLGTGTRTVPISLDQIQIDQAHNHLEVAMSKDQIKALPILQANKKQWSSSEVPAGDGTSKQN